jgi:hypothetical protein
LRTQLPTLPALRDNIKAPNPEPGDISNDVVGFQFVTLDTGKRMVYAFSLWMQWRFEAECFRYTRAEYRRGRGEG